MATISAMPSIYSDITDTEFLGYNTEAEKKWAELAKSQEEIASLQTQLESAKARVIPPTVDGDTDWDAENARQAEITSLQTQLNETSARIVPLQGEAQVLETKRENRGAVLKQGGANTQAGTAGAEAVKNENLLSQNINQELVGRIARNTAQAKEAQTSVNLLSAATLGRQAALAGQAGYNAESGTSRALAASATSKSAADQAAIEGYRIGRQNLLMGQGDAATKAAESLTGSINKTTADWSEKSSSALTDVTGTLLANVEQLTAAEGFTGDANTQGVKDAYAAVDTTLGTWSYDSYLDVLDTLTSKSANKSTWDQMLLEQGSTPENPYSQFNTALSPLTPLAGTSSNLLAAAAGSPDVYTSKLSGTNNNGRLI